MMRYIFFGECPKGQRGRPMSEAGVKRASEKGIETCTKTTKDNRTLTYRSPGQKEKDKETKSKRQEYRKKFGIARGRLPKNFMEKADFVVDEMKTKFKNDTIQEEKKKEIEKSASAKKTGEIISNLHSSYNNMVKQFKEMRDSIEDIREEMEKAQKGSRVKESLTKMYEDAKNRYNRLVVSTISEIERMEKSRNAKPKKEPLYRITEETYRDPKNANLPENHEDVFFNDPDAFEFENNQMFTEMILQVLGNAIYSNKDDQVIVDFENKIKNILEQKNYSDLNEIKSFFDSYIDSVKRMKKQDHDANPYRSNRGFRFYDKLKKRTKESKFYKRMNSFINKKIKKMGII